MAKSKTDLFLEMAFDTKRGAKSLTGIQILTSLRTGSIIQFTYDFAKHDKNPLVILTENKIGEVKGLNLHYILPDPILQIISPNGMNACNNPRFSWQSVKFNPYIKKAFRIYKKNGIRNLRMLDCDYLKKVIAASRKLNIQDLTALRSAIDAQLQQTNQNANQFMNRA
jgi:hypothetical protein